MSSDKKTSIYDPVKFINDNANKILPAQSTVLKVEFSGFIKRAFHSNDRPNGIITIHYQINSDYRELQLFVKQHKNAQKVFDHLSSIYSGLSSYKMEFHIPKPIICDKVNNANYMEFISGKALIYKVLPDLLLQRNKQLSQLLYQIGYWLKSYHNISRLEKTITINEIKENVYNELSRTSIFNIAEKKEIRDRLQNLVFDNTYLILVKPHNDFALRNIIYTKSESFKVIDWDAFFHKKFKTESPVWNDITSFVISVNSLKRFAPVISDKDVNTLTKSFFEGYFQELSIPSQKTEIINHLYLFTLSYYLGIIGDRSLSEIYKGKLGFRYTKKLHDELINGFSYK